VKIQFWNRIYPRSGFGVGAGITLLFVSFLERGAEFLERGAEFLERGDKCRDREAFG